MSHITLITGGARSGKSSFAEDLIREKGENILYVATAKPIDEEMMEAEKALVAEVQDFIACFKDLSCDLILVTNEVGLGLVPEYPISRFYRDALGRVNQALGKAADEVYFVTCGVPMKIKG